MVIWELDPNQFDEQLRDIRLDRQLTQKELSKLTNCTQNKIGSYERGFYTPTMDHLVAIANELGIDEIRINTSELYHKKAWIKYRNR